MSTSPLTEETNLTSFTITSDGQEIPDTYEVLSIKTHSELNKIADAEIILIDGDPSTQEFNVTNSKVFMPGAKIEIKLGYHSKDETVFKGIVVKQQLKIDHDSGSLLHVICKDEAIKMTINRQNAIFVKKTDSAVIESLIKDAGLSAEVTSTKIEYNELVQYYVTPWDFLMSRAEVNGMVTYTNNGTVVVEKPSIDGSPELVLTYGQDILDFDGELDATFQYAESKGSAWDMKTQKMIEANATEPTVNKQGNISGKKLADVLGAGTSIQNTAGNINNDSIKEWADAALIKSRLSRFKGHITFQGSDKATVNSLIELKGLSDRFDGNAFISGVTHTLAEGNWLTEVHIGLSSFWFVESHHVAAPLASGLLPGIRGLQTGIVKKTYEDPDNEFRVQVDIPILGEQAEGIWARLSTFYASNTFGTFFMPEVGDEVILGFMNDDPRFPIILGSVYSSKLPASETPDEQNTIKSILTKSKLQLKFDDEKKIITVATPAGNTVTFNDDESNITLTDQNNNKIEMNSSGISLDSPGSITIKATEEVSIKAATVSVTADQSVDISGASVTMSGDMSTSIKGGAECSVSSDGNLTAKGLMVMIN